MVEGAYQVRVPIFRTSGQTRRLSSGKKDMISVPAVEHASRAICVFWMYDFDARPCPRSPPLNRPARPRGGKQVSSLPGYEVNVLRPGYEAD